MKKNIQIIGVPMDLLRMSCVLNGRGERSGMAKTIRRSNLRPSAPKATTLTFFALI